MKYIGIDGGGTKTKFALYDENLNKLDSTILETSHIGQVGKDGLYNILQAGIGYFNLTEKPILCASLAGYGVVTSYKKAIDEVFSENFSQYKHIVMSDIESAYFGASGIKDGIVVICGTGSIGLSYKDGAFRRVGGYGPVFGDEGSAYYIGKSLISAFFRQSDGRDEKTLLYQAVRNYFDTTYDYDILTLLSNDRTTIASLASLCYNCAKDGDIHAIDIFKNTSNALLDIVKALSIDFDYADVSFIGGVTKSFDILFDYILQGAPHNVSFKKPINTPEYGAVLAYLKRVAYED